MNTWCPLGYAFAIVLLMGVAMASEGGDLRLVLDVPPSSFLALRFNVTEDTDIEVAIRSYTCEDENGTDPQAHGHRFLIDGQFSFASFSMGGGWSGAPEQRLIEVGAQENTATAPQLWEDGIIPEDLVAIGGGGCWRSTYDMGPWLRGASRDGTDVRWTSATPAKVFANITWTRGVLGYDISMGPILAVKPHQFEEGASVGVTPSFLAGASVGALLSQTVATQHDTLGIWWPYAGAHPGGDSFCYQDGTACPTFSNYYSFQSEGPTTWQWGFHLRPELSTPHYPLIVIELPDDSYLYD